MDRLITSPRSFYSIHRISGLKTVSTLLKLLDYMGPSSLGVWWCLTFPASFIQILVSLQSCILTRLWLYKAENSENHSFLFLNSACTINCSVCPLYFPYFHLPVLPIPNTFITGLMSYRSSTPLSDQPDALENNCAGFSPNEAGQYDEFALYPSSLSTLLHLFRSFFASVPGTISNLELEFSRSLLFFISASRGTITNVQ